MNTTLKHLALAAMVLLSAGGASAAVTAAFSHPENYLDLPPADREQVLKGLSEHFARLGKDLPPGQDLRVEVLDLDMAGHVRPNFRGRQDLRILRGSADWPTMVVRYTLESNGKVIASGEDKLSDLAYLQRSNHYWDTDALRYEKRMIDDWFKAKFVRRQRG